MIAYDIVAVCQFFEYLWFSLANMVSYLNRAADDLILSCTLIAFNLFKNDLVRLKDDGYTWQLAFNVHPAGRCLVVQPASIKMS